MRRARERDEEFERLVKRHENHVYRAAVAVMGNRSDAEDVMQDVFIKAYQRAPAFESEQHERAWLLKVTVNLCRDRLRNMKLRQTEPIPESYPTPEKGEPGIVEQVLKLAPKYRAVIHLYYYEGYSTKEIASLTAQRESTVRSLLSRARDKLRIKLEAEHESI